MRSLYLSVEKWTTAFSMLVACLMLAVAACLGMLQIFTRFVLETPIEWTEVIIRFSLSWMVFMGIPMAFRQGAMVSVDVRPAHEEISRHRRGTGCTDLGVHHHLVGLGLRQPRQGPVHDRA